MKSKFFLKFSARHGLRWGEAPTPRFRPYFAKATKGRLLCLCIACLACNSAHAIKYTWGGFARLDSFFDTRNIVSVDSGAVAMYPVAPDCDSNKCDINAYPNFGMTPAISRIFFKIDDCKINECNLTGYIESDFSGAQDIAGLNTYTAGMLKMRHAYLNAVWQKNSVLLGAAYHPVFVLNCCPNTVNFGVGRPITLYAYGPQIRLNRQWHEFTAGITFYSQFLFRDWGPVGYSRTYMHQALLPETCLTLAWQKHDTVAGVLFDVKRIQPAVYTSPATDATLRYVTQQRLTSLMGSVWLGFNVNNVRINNQFVVCQNGPDFSTISGYAVSRYNATTGACTYTNITSVGAWTDLEYVKDPRFTPGVYVGYTKNIDAHDCVYLDPLTHVPTFYGFQYNLDSVLRVAPRAWSKFHNVVIGLEFDYTRAWFGPMNSCGQHPCTTPVDNVRMLLVTEYQF